MEVQFKITSVTRGGVVRANVVPQSNVDKNALKESGMPGFGSMELVVHDQKELEGFETGKTFTVDIELDEPEVVEQPITGK